MANETVTQLLVDWSSGDASALERLTPIVYSELRKLAASHLRRERNGHTLQTLALVHEAYLRLVGQNRVAWRSRSHFFGIAAQMMRRVLVDHARSRGYARRGRGALHLSLDEAPEIAADLAPEILEVDEALSRLAAVYPESARIVELRFFGGLPHEEIAEVTGLSLPTVQRRWRMARAWLYRHLSPHGGRR